MNNLFLTDHKTGERYGVGRGTVWRWFNNGNFPAPVKLSPGCTRWRLADLEKWEAEKDTSDTGQQAA